jgi:predicted alpha/beta superfamily hydrolase
MQIQPSAATPLSLVRPIPAAGSNAPVEPCDKVDFHDDPGEPAWGQSLTGDIRYHQVDSKVLGNSRGVWVYLPADYWQKPDQKFPVLYACDGQNVFEKGTAFGGTEWGMDEAAQEKMRQGEMQDAIIVAVSNGGADRLNEYTPVADPSAQHRGGGGAENYSHFLIDELKPMIDARYRTTQEVDKTGIIGSSLGGLYSLYAGFHHPETFGLVGAMSPSIWWADREMLDEVAKAPAGKGPDHIWLSMGTAEDPEDLNHNGVPDVLDDTRSLVQLLEQRGYQEGKNLTYHEIDGAQHNEHSWSEQIPDALVDLYPAQGQVAA